jgi:hypothetical protein
MLMETPESKFGSQDFSIRAVFFRGALAVWLTTLPETERKQTL